jgi:hypothetical protein
VENLNDAEFGSNKNAEEAPILVAQRYLNIFRQVHIFNKAKRDQFDDELLALPPVITDFFKRMPGGRLLVEHIEEVKTERGISFVKANKEDFAEGSGIGGSSAAPAVQTGGAIAPIVGGSITVDASFAEALAQSMATAFKQTPMQATVSGGGTVNSTLDFGNAFDVIAEEIKTSRASLLDVLKETRSITDSVIASQVSISRILEGILSARTKDDIGTADLNNRIIASQASITKLLEGLYATNNQRNHEISDYLNIENKLQSFKNEVRLEIENSLNKMQEMFIEYAKNIQVTPANIYMQAPIPSEQNIHSLNKEPVVKHFDTTPQTATTFDDDDDFEEDDTEVNNSYTNTDISTPKKKKKKKKKNKNLLNNSINEQQSNSSNSGETILSVATIPAVDGVIRNQTFKHEDNFKNVDLSQPPLESNESQEDIAFELDSDLSNFSSFSNPLDEDSFDDGLDFVLPEESSSLDDDVSYSETAENIADSNSDDGLDFELPNIDHSIEEHSLTSIDELSSDNASDLDSFAFEEENTENETLTTIAEDPTFTSIDELSSDNASDLDSFAFEEENTEDETLATIAEEEPTFTSLDELSSDNVSDLDSFAFEEENAEDETLTTIAEEEPTFTSLDELSSEENPIINIEEKQELITTNKAPEHHITQSRYSAELDKIREALTSDNIDISSIDEPIALDDYGDDDNLVEDDLDEENSDEWEYEYVEDLSSEEELSAETDNNTQDNWEYEYVDENGNPVEPSSDDDWEWEYVEEDTDDNNQ